MDALPPLGEEAAKVGEAISEAAACSPQLHAPPPLRQQAAQQQPLVSSSSSGSVARTKQLSNSCACFPELSSAPRMRNSICPSVPSTANRSSSLILALCKTPPSRGELPCFTLGLEVSYMRNKSKMTYSLFSLGIIILYHYQVSAFPFFPTSQIRESS